MTTTTEQVAMDGSPATSELFNRKNDPNEIHGPYGEIKWQLGPIQEVGINGTTIEDVLEVCADRLRGFNRDDSPFKCRENSLAITSIEEAINWLLQRTRKRQEQGVEGFNKPHAT